MNVYVKVLIFSFLTLVVQHVLRLGYIYLSIGNDIIKHYPGKCEHVKGLTTPGSEDMTLLPSGKLIITSGLTGFGGLDYTKSKVKGQLYVMDTNKDVSSVEKLIVKGWPEDDHFDPHGIDHWQHENNSVSIFVVFHMPERVARLMYDGDKTLTLTKIYENPQYMRNLNSVAATSDDSFYFSNILGAKFNDKFMLFVEFFLYLPKAYIGYVEGDNYMFAAEGLLIPNGIVKSSRHLYVAAKESVLIYSMNADHTLKLFKSIPITIGSKDNVKLDAAGDLWIGCQNTLGEVLTYMDKPTELKCHSTVIRVRDPTGVAEVESVFVDDTSLLQASTVAVYAKGRLYIGSINDKMLSCEVNYLSGQ